MDDKFTEKYADVLHNIEFAIVSTYRVNPDVLDYHVDSALEAAITRYAAEEQGRTPRPIQLEGARLAVYDAVLNVCEWRRGRQQITAIDDAESDEPLEPKTAGEIAACLKRIRKSAQGWTRRGGRQGYLQFVSRYLG